MPQVSRRAFITRAAAIPFAVWAQRSAFAQQPFVRYEASTPQGQAMLKIYADGVRRMMKIAEAEATSWLFQWYTHAVKGSASKADEIKRVYGNGASPHRKLADEMWDTCRPHFGGDIADFLPWHRMYVYFFERIVRKVSGDASFALPYWNYSAADPALHGIMPAAFRLPASNSNPLYRENRRNSVNRDAANDGRAIDQNTPPDTLGLGALTQTSFRRSGVEQGFSETLNLRLHGAVHVLVGDLQNMGDVPWAARDPIFWLHHCNIDRIWASWNSAGGMNPAGDWLNRTFVFADENGQSVSVKTSDFVAIDKLGYVYDRLEPPRVNINVLQAAPPPPSVARPIAKAARVSLTSSAVRIPLVRAMTQVESVAPLADRIKALKPGSKLLLVLRRLQAAAQPGVIYETYLDAPESVTFGDLRKPEVRPHFVGSFNFFDAVPHRDHAAGAEERSVSFDVTATLRRIIQTKGKLSDHPAVTILPAGKPSAAAQPSIGEIAFVEQLDPTK